MRLSVGTGVGPFRVSQTLFRSNWLSPRRRRRQRSSAFGSLLVLCWYLLLFVLAIAVLELVLAVALVWAAVLGVTWLVPATKGWSRERTLDTEQLWARRRGRPSRRERDRDRVRAADSAQQARDEKVRSLLTAEDREWLDRHSAF